MTPEVSLAPRVLLVDDHALLVAGLTMALRREGIEVESADPDGDDVVQAAGSFDPDVVLLDLMFDASGGSGRDLIAPLREVCRARIVMLTGVTDRIELAACLDAGADALAAKADDLSVIVEVVVRAARGEIVLAPERRDELLAELREYRRDRRERLAPFESLTPREQEVLAALMRGLTAPEIAEEFYVGLGTVRSQVKAIRTKLGVSSQITAVGMALQAGWDPGLVAAG